MRPIRILSLIALLRASSVLAGDGPAPAVPPDVRSEKAIQEVVVRAGPPLWKVTSGQHTLWILVEPPTPVPTNFVWRSQQVEIALASAQELILDGGVTFNSIRSKTPLSAATYQDMRAVPFPQSSLKDAIPVDLYRRFEVLKAAFAANYDSMEQLRPWAAGFELSRHVMKALNLSDSAVSETVQRLGWRATVLHVDTYADYAEFQKNSRGGRMVACLEEIVSELETDRDERQRLEDAWSVGDINVLRTFALRQKTDTCTLDMFDNEEQASYVTHHHTEHWLAVVDLALKNCKTSFALVPADKIFASDGWLTALRARGYAVQEPG